MPDKADKQDLINHQVTMQETPVHSEGTDNVCEPINYSILAMFRCTVSNVCSFPLLY